MQLQKKAIRRRGRGRLSPRDRVNFERYDGGWFTWKRESRTWWSVLLSFSQRFQAGLCVLRRGISVQAMNNNTSPGPCFVVFCSFVAALVCVLVKIAIILESIGRKWALYAAKGSGIQRNKSFLGCLYRRAKTEDVFRLKPFTFFRMLFSISSMQLRYEGESGLIRG